MATRMSELPPQDGAGRDDSAKQIERTQPDMQETAALTELHQDLRDRLRDTERHLARFEEVFAAQGLRGSPRSGEALNEAIAENVELLHESSDQVVDNAALLGASQRAKTLR